MKKIRMWPPNNEDMAEEAAHNEDGNVSVDNYHPGVTTKHTKTAMIISADDDGDEFISNDDNEAPIVSGYEAADGNEDKAPVVSGYDAADDAREDVDKAPSIMASATIRTRLPLSAITRPQTTHMMRMRVPSLAQMMTEMNPSATMRTRRLPSSASGHEAADNAHDVDKGPVISADDDGKYLSATMRTRLPSSAAVVTRPQEMEMNPSAMMTRTMLPLSVALRSRR
jgi:hypothetical protein